MQTAEPCCKMDADAVLRMAKLKVAHTCPCRLLIEFDAMPSYHVPGTQRVRPCWPALQTVTAASYCAAMQVVSTMGTTTLEDVAAAASDVSQHMFQLYVIKDRDFSKQLVQVMRAVLNGPLLLVPGLAC